MTTGVPRVVALGPAVASVAALVLAACCVSFYRQVNALSDGPGSGAISGFLTSFGGVRLSALTAAVALLVAAAALAVRRRGDALGALGLAVATVVAFAITPVPITGATVTYVSVGGTPIFRSFLVAAALAVAVALGAAVLAVRSWRTNGDRAPLGTWTYRTVPLLALVAAAAAGYAAYWMGTLPASADPFYGLANDDAGAGGAYSSALALTLDLGRLHMAYWVVVAVLVAVLLACLVRRRWVDGALAAVLLLAGAVSLPLSPLPVSGDYSIGLTGPSADTLTPSIACWAAVVLGSLLLAVRAWRASRTTPVQPADADPRP